MLPPAVLPPAVLPPAVPPQVLLPQVPPQATAILPAAPAVAQVAAAASQPLVLPPGQAARAGGWQVPAAPKDADSVGALLLEVVAERTGYPADMLNLDMELDTDLGIDSIKKVEILSTVRERVGDVPGDLAAFATLRTLREIAEQYAQLATAAGDGPARRALPGPAAGPAAGPAPAPVAPVTRRAVRAVPAPASGLAMLGLTAGPLAVTDDGAGIAPLLVARSPATAFTPRSSPTCRPTRRSHRAGRLAAGRLG